MDFIFDSCGAVFALGFWFDPHADLHAEDLESGGEDICRILSAAPCFLLLFSHYLHRGDTFRPFSGMGTSKGCWDAFDVLRLAFRSRELQMRFCVQLVSVCSQVPRVYSSARRTSTLSASATAVAGFSFTAACVLPPFLDQPFSCLFIIPGSTALPSARPFVLVAQTTTTLQEKVY